MFMLLCTVYAAVSLSISVWWFLSTSLYNDLCWEISLIRQKQKGVNKTVVEEQVDPSLIALIKYLVWQLSMCCNLIYKKYRELQEIRP